MRGGEVVRCTQIYFTALRARNGFDKKMPCLCGG